MSSVFCCVAGSLKTTTRKIRGRNTHSQHCNTKDILHSRHDCTRVALAPLLRTTPVSVIFNACNQSLSSRNFNSVLLRCMFTDLTLCRAKHCCRGSIFMIQQKLLRGTSSQQPQLVVTLSFLGNTGEPGHMSIQRCLRRKRRASQQTDEK